MKIQLESNYFDEKCQCHLCGTIFFAEEIIARAYRSSDEYITDVCPQCLASGDTGISHRIRKQADYLRRLASELEKLADADIETPSFEHFQTVKQLTKSML
ncbi:MAG: hypothetical protein J7545_19275 [Roseofilum sp. SBFL]|uniref:hypothetical protein n=1 Tax=unclassified Roseofilum TaxID=2620099 RepID=UPI001B2C4746|nr:MULTISPECIES: hypothetical protein [unclassified Roseofilum]MBP0013177.1 hypothetical protein [Roseofilum sp. SID3]MBP0023246.1 hypothetical protein [Roseofilum sp. SID2]MBP0039391.1 hypothetical protein [Roseofilum sp. SID1]MBP0044086.1 hypothetical protein [Roseofilum sp. SBFL]